MQLTSIVCRGGGLPGAGTYVAPSLNHAGCVITTSGFRKAADSAANRLT